MRPLSSVSGHFYLIRRGTTLALDPLFDALAFYGRVAHRAEFGAILLAGLMTLAYFARREWLGMKPRPAAGDPDLTSA
jgi:hypothetical protein